MFGVGFSEIIVIVIVALVFVGPKKLPDLAKQAGRLFVQFRRMTGDVRSTVDDFIRKAEEEIRQEERQALLKILGAESNTAQPSLATLEHEHTQDHSHHGEGHHDPHHLSEGHTPDHGASQIIDTTATTQVHSEPTLAPAVSTEKSDSTLLDPVSPPKV